MNSLAKEFRFYPIYEEKLLNTLSKKVIIAFMF